MFLEILQNSPENTRDSFLIKLQALLKIESLAQVFSCEFWEISKNIFSYRTASVAASGSICSTATSIFITITHLQVEHCIELNKNLSKKRQRYIQMIPLRTANFQLNILLFFVRASLVDS